MNYFKKKNDLILIPETPGEIKLIFAVFFVIIGISLTLSAVGGLFYLLISPSLEFLMLAGGSLAFGLILLYLTSRESIQEKFQRQLLPSTYTIAFTERAIIFKDFRDCYPEMYIPSSNLESIDIQEESRIKTISTIGPPIPYASNRFIPPFEIKTKKLVLNLKDGREKIIWLKDYSKDKQDQENLVETIQEYCEEKYPEVEIPTVNAIEADSDKPQIKK